MNVDNSQTNKKNVVNVAAPTKQQSLPIAIPVGRNKAPPPPQVFVPVATNPAPITYALNPPNDVQDILNQPAAVMLGEGPEMAAYVPPTYTTEQPTELPQVPQTRAPEQLAQLAQLAQIARISRASAESEQETPFWKKPQFVMPVAVVLIIALALWLSSRGKSRPMDAYYSPQT